MAVVLRLAVGNSASQLESHSKLDPFETTVFSWGSLCLGGLSLLGASLLGGSFLGITPPSPQRESDSTEIKEGSIVRAGKYSPPTFMRCCFLSSDECAAGMGGARSHFETLVLYKLSARKFTTQNNICQ